MTNEEEIAIAIIRNEYLCVDRDCDIERSCGKCDLAMPSKEPILKAFKMAMQALETIPKYKDAYNKGWDDGAKATYEHLKMCEEEQSGDLISKQAVIDIIHRFFTEEVDKIPTKKTEDGEVYVIHKCQPLFEMNKAICKRIRALQAVNPQEPNIKSLGEDLRICQNSITDDKVLIGFNIAVAICNKYFAGSEGQE